jgi:hypothetical protein
MALPGCRGAGNARQFGVVRRLVLTLIALAVPLACGGRSEEREQAGGGKGGQGTGGTGANGGSAMTGGSTATGGSAMTGGSTATGGSATTGGSTATGGTGGTAGTGPGCCLAYPTCAPGEVEHQGPCAPELGCRSVTICCSTIQCVPESPATGGSGGTGGDPSDAGVACDPELEHDRNYIGDLELCARVDFDCAAPTKMFFSACGCGCEQDASCPPAFDCGPGERIAPELACTEENLLRCPFSEILE